MATDISPELYEKITKRFDELRLSDKTCEAMRQRFQAGAATYREGGKYAERVGRHLSRALQEVLTEDVLPNGTLYFNIAENTLGKALYMDAELISQAAEQIQTGINASAGIRLKPVKVKPDAERIRGLVDAAASVETFEESAKFLGEPVVNFTQHIMDSHVKANAEFQSKAGLNVRVEREYDGVGLHDGTDVCEFCTRRAGSWTYDKAMSVGAFERHENCGCTIDYVTKKGVVQRQTNWRNNEWQDRIDREQELLSRRRQ